MNRLPILIAIAAFGTSIAAVAQSGSDDPPSRSISRSVEQFKEKSLEKTSTSTEKDAATTGDVDTERKVDGFNEMFTLDDFEKALAESKLSPVLVFKHSTQCNISAGAYDRMSAYMKHEDAPKTYMVKVIERRPVSNEIETRTEVKHESPQVILLKDGKPVWNTSHEAITEEAVRKALADLEGE